MRVVGLVQRMNGRLIGGAFRRSFSQVAAGNGNIPKAFEDWQYCRMITQQLKNNNINNALSLLFQSYFNNQVLDIQIYNQIQEKIIAAALPLSYAQILYIIYRDHFPPHVLILNWMNKLALSKSDDFIQKLKKDYQILGQPFPHRATRAAKREAKKQVKQQKAEVGAVQEEPASLPKKSRSNKVLTSPISSVELPNVDVPKLEGDMTPEELYQSRITTEVKNALSQLNIDINTFSRVVVHDVDIQFGNDNEGYDDDETPSEQQQEFGEDEMQNIGLLGFDISQIKIGKIQFFNDNRKDQ